MLELSASNASLWLIGHGFPSLNLHCSELGGGISNKLVLAEGPEFRAVLKQSLGQLRTEREWNSDRARIFREAGAMRWAEHLAGMRVPRVLCDDAADFTIAMEGGAGRSGDVEDAAFSRRVPDGDCARGWHRAGFHDFCELAECGD